MKTKQLFPLLIAFAFCLSAVTQKPRYLKFATPGCPLDPLTSILPGGILQQNATSVTIVPSPPDTLLLISELLPKGAAFDIIQQIGNYSIIRLWPLNANQKITSAAQSLLQNYASNSTLAKSNAQTRVNAKSILIKLTGGGTIDLSKNDYIIPTKILLANSKELESKYHQWNVGVLAMPIKIRPVATKSGQFDFIDGVSFGTTFAWTADHNWEIDRTINFFFYAGVSSFTADKEKLGESADRTDYKLTTFSPGAGLMFEKSNIQLTFMTGIDFPAGGVQKTWVYRNMPWFGIGLGFSIFKISNDDSTKTGVNN